MSRTSIEYHGKRLELPVYLDYQATTRLDPWVLEAMLPYFGERFGNPHSSSHVYGWDAERAVEQARGEIAALIGAAPAEIVFTSGATESNNLAILGAARAAAERGRRHVMTCVTEHPCVLGSVDALQRDGFEVTRLPVGADGLIDLDRIEAEIRDDTALVSVMAVNNEIGVLQPLAEIGALCAARGVLFHSDAAQGAGKIPIDVHSMHIDLLSLTGHKFYGPMGIGALYVRANPPLAMRPLFAGGGQERGLRPGTVPLALSVGLGKACALANDEMRVESERLVTLREGLRRALTERLAGVTLNGSATRRIPGNLNVSIEGIDAPALIEELDELAFSTGSACASGSGEPSHVLHALGLSDEAAHASIRIGLGRFTTPLEVDFAAERIAAAVGRLR